MSNGGAGTITSVVRDVIIETKDANGSVCFKIHPVGANEGDTIRWDFSSMRVSVWFPHEGVFATPILASGHMGVLEATVLRKDPSKGEKPINGEFHYCVFWHDHGIFAEWQSHPKVEIPKP